MQYAHLLTSSAVTPIHLRPRLLLHNLCGGCRRARCRESEVCEIFDETAVAGAMVGFAFKGCLLDHRHGDSGDIGAVG